MVETGVAVVVLTNMKIYTNSDVLEIHKIRLSMLAQIPQIPAGSF